MSQHEHCGCHSRDSYHCHEHEHCHSHEHECSCGHHHRATTKIDLIIIIISAVLTVTGLIALMTSLKIISAVLFIIAAAVTVVRPAFDGAKGLLRLNIDENVLLTLAVVAAIIIGEFAEAALVSLLFAVGQYIESTVSGKSRSALEMLSEIRPDTVHTDSGDLHAEDAHIGDTIIIRPFERIPLDCAVISGSSEIDASAITGESVPIVADEGVPLLSGMQNGAGVLRATVTKDYHDSAASRIIRLVEESSESKGESERFITKFARIYTPCVVISAILVTLIPSLIIGKFSVEWLHKSLVFLVASCPCSLVISVPLAFFAGVGAASRQGVLIKGGVHIESLSRVRAAAFDKTGTLTSGELTVTNVTNFTDRDSLAIAAAAETQSEHPIARAICAACAYPVALSGNITERAGFGITVSGEHIYHIGAARLMKMESIDISAAPTANVYVAEDGVLVGAIEIADTPRDDTLDLIRGLRSRGFSRIAMLTGDRTASASTVAQQCEIDDVHAELLPEDKVKLITDISNEQCGALFVGDGINDAPVIAAATVGVAMGLGTDAAVETADIVLTSGNPSALLRAIDISHRTIGIVKFNIALSIIVKFAVIISAFFAPVMWAAVVADVVLSVVCSLNSARLMTFIRDDRAGHR